MDYKKSLTCLALSMAALSVSAQSQTVTGKIVDNDGLEVIGASVSLKGEKGVGAVSDINGNFTIKAKNASKDVLVISYIGMKTQEVKVGGKKQLDVRLEPNAITMDDVVVIGYGAVKRKDLTGSVSSVKSDELLKTPTNDISQALAGRIAGLQVQRLMELLVQVFLSAFVAVSLSRKATSLCMLSMVSLQKTVLVHSTQLLLNQ